MPTKREVEFWEQVMRRTARLRPAASREILRMLRLLRSYLSDAEVARLMEDGSIDAAIGRLLSDERLAAAGNPLRHTLLVVLFAGANATLDRLPYASERRLVFNVLHPDVTPVLLDLDQKLMAALQRDIVATLRAEAQRAVLAGLPPREVAQILRGFVGLGPTQAAQVAAFAARQQGTPAQIAKLVAAYRNRRIALNVETIARTAVLDAYKAGQHQAIQQAVARGLLDEDRLYKTWVNMADARVRDEHKDRGGMGGQTVLWNQRYSNGEMIPGESTWNCFFAGTLVEGAFVGGLKTLYAGPVREIKTARGHTLSATPNHPVLTANRGWVPIGQLCKSDTLLSNRVGVEPSGPDTNGVHDQHGPARVEEIFNTFASDGAGVARAVTRLDLHGDGVGASGEVHVVWANRDLRSEAMVGVNDGIDDGLLHATGVRQAQIAGLGALDLCRETVFLSAPRSVRGVDLPEDENWIVPHTRPLQVLRCGTSSDWHVPLAEPSKQDDALIPAVVRQLLQARPGEIDFDQIVEIRDFQTTTATHIYDLQTRDGLMLAQGIVVSNCRCVSHYSTLRNL